MNQKRIEEITLHLFILGAALIFGVHIRQVALSYGMDNFSSHIFLIAGIILFCALYLSVQTCINTCLLSYIERQLIKIPSYYQKRIPQEKELNEDTTDDNIEIPKQPIISEYEQLHNAAQEAKKRLEHERLDRVITYTKEALALYMEENDLKQLIEYLILFHNSYKVPHIPVSVKINRQIKTIDLMHFGWNIGNQFKKSGIEISQFIKQVFADRLKDVEATTIVRKLRCEGTCIIKIKEQL